MGNPTSHPRVDSVSDVESAECALVYVAPMGCTRHVRVLCPAPAFLAELRNRLTSAGTERLLTFRAFWIATIVNGHQNLPLNMRIL